MIQRFNLARNLEFLWRETETASSKSKRLTNTKTSCSFFSFRYQQQVANCMCSWNIRAGVSVLISMSVNIAMARKLELFTFSYQHTIKIALLTFSQPQFTFFQNDNAELCKTLTQWTNRMNANLVRLCLARCGFKEPCKFVISSLNGEYEIRMKEVCVFVFYQAYKLSQKIVLGFCAAPESQFENRQMEMRKKEN